MTPRYLLLGDTHGDLQSVAEACALAKAKNIHEVIQLGDWGFLWPRANQLAALHRTLERYGCVMKFIDGNHDWHEAIEMHHAANTFPKTLEYLPRGHVFTMDNGVKVGCLGGGTSIDKAYRKEGKSWFATETITMDQVNRLTTCDVLLTHDAPILPVGMGPPPIHMDAIMMADAKKNRDMVAAAVERTGAKKLFHGHYHYSWSGDYHHGCMDCDTTKIYGLSHNGRAGSILLVDENWDVDDWALEDTW